MDAIERDLHDKVSAVMEKITHIETLDFASQRTSADQIEHRAREVLLEQSNGFSPPRGTRQPGDIIYQSEQVTFHINFKSTDLSKDFHMPNLISSENLWKILSRGERFMILKFNHLDDKITDWSLWNIMDIDWKNLTIGALGTGQIQIKDGLKNLSKYQGTHEEWCQDFKKQMLAFYSKEKSKIDSRMAKWQKRLV